MKSIIPFLFFILFSIDASANSSFGAKTIKRIYFHDSGQLRIEFNEPATHTEPCSIKHIYTIDENYKFFQEMYSGLLAAMHSKSTVSGWVNGCVNDAVTNITRLDLFPN